MASDLKPVDIPEGEGETTEQPCPNEEVCDNNAEEDKSAVDFAAVHRNFEEWCEIPVFGKPSEHSTKCYKLVYDDWKALTNAIKQNHSEYVVVIGKLFEHITRTLKKVRMLIVMKKDSKYKEEISHTAILLAAFDCLTAIMQGAACQDGFYEPIYQYIEKSWKYMVGDFVTNPLTNDAQIGCAVLDVFAAMGSELFNLLAESDQRRIIVFLIGYGGEYQLSVNMKSKVIRCLGKMIEFPTLKDDRSFFADVLEIVERGIMSGERDVKISSAWTFANLTDVLLEGRVRTPITETYQTFSKKLFDIALNSTDVHMRGRYNACRACGNLFKWMNSDTLLTVQMMALVSAIAMRLMKMIGSGMDYKLRWNAAHAIGCAFENEEFFITFASDTTGPLIKTLAKWSAQSQNYKERTQCVVSLMKVKTRKMYDGSYPYVFDRLSLSLSRLPVEECENIKKFKIEGVLLFFHLVSLLQKDDIDFVQETILRDIDSLTSCVVECTPEILHERLDPALAARENLTQLSANSRSSQHVDCITNIFQILDPVLVRD